MVKLINSISGKLATNLIGEVKYLSPIMGQIQGEDYINMYGLIYYLQNFSKIEKTELLDKPVNFGLFNKSEQLTLDVSY